ncbi:MAG TPA: flagellar basal-body MS-ring/collar protein FliF [Bryobacteraceae bacterium]|jgi:flagellar M-ring protein FliF
MNQLTQLWNRLSWTQRITILVVFAGVIGGLLVFSHWNQERDFKPLFSGLAAEDAGTVTAKLKELGVEYRLNDADTILVSSEKIAEVRLQLASAGLPKSGRIGFELFDKVNFGASDFAEQVNYHRAIEGELERSVMSIREVEQARVHLTFAKDSLYTEQREPAKASVLVKLRATAGLSPQNVAAICQLTASAVPGLSPDQVSLVDTAGNLLNRPRAPGLDGDGASEAALDYRKSVERDLQSKIGQTLEPLLGANHFRVGVSADVDLSSGDQSEETYDPQKSVMLSSQTSQDGPSLPTASGVPGTPSNLPNPVSAPAMGVSNYARHNESITYQNSRVVRHTKLPQGVLKKLSLSVLVDHSLRWEGTKKIVEAPSADKLKVIHDLVAAATGLNPDRGDQLVVEAFPFEATLQAEPATFAAPVAAAAAPSNVPLWLQKLLGQKNFAMIAGIAGGVALALVVGLLVLLKRAGRKARIRVEAAAAELEEAKTKELAAPPDVEKQMQSRMAEQAAEKAKQEVETLLKLKLPEVSTKKTEVLVKHITAETKKDPTAMAQVVRSWLHGDTVQR